MSVKPNQSGFTIVELLISIAIASVISILMLTVTINYVGDVTRARLTADLAIESQILLRSIVEDTRLAGSLSSTNQNIDANSPVGGWITNDPSNVLIIDTPAFNVSRDIIYDSTTGLPYDNEVVYFSSGTRMFRRMVASTSATGNAAKTTCPTATALCGKDKQMTTYLQDLTFTFYDENNTTTADATLARSVQITVNLKRKISGRDVSFNNTMRTTMRNR
jgi:prepilin-type N-terminal cleavage/methylation domain-containing protein